MKFHYVWMGLGLATASIISGCASAPESAQSSLTEASLETKADEKSDILSSRNDSVTSSEAENSSTDKASMHACNRSELAAAQTHCNEHHASWFPGYPPAPCQLTGCMSNGHMVYYAW